MPDEFILKGTAYWCYDYEIATAGALAYAGQLGVSFHRYKGNILLTNTAVTIDGDESLQIELSSIREIYLGCDDIYRPEYLKNFGYFNKPLRVEYYLNRSRLSKLYFFIRNGIINTNNKWYNTLSSMLS